MDAAPRTVRIQMEHFDSSKASAKKFGTLLVWAQRECNYKAGQTYQQFTFALPDSKKGDQSCCRS